MSRNIDVGTDVIDYDLDERHLPSSQVERIPFLEDHRGDELFSPSSLRANFIPIGAATQTLDSHLKGKYSGLFQETPLFSPVFANLPSVKPDTLFGVSAEKQELRRKLLRGSNVLIVQGGYSGKRFIYEKLKALGIKVTIMDGPDSVWKQAVEEGLIEYFVELDFTDYETVLERALDQIMELDVSFDGVTTYFENAVPLAARIATALGVETNPPEACDKARSKSLTRQVMKEHGLTVPKFYKILQESEIAAACDIVGFPAVLKPSFGAASFGVFRVNSKEETKEMYHKIMVTLDSQAGGDFDDLWSQGTEMLLEEYYDGDEFDIDIVLSNGDVVYVKVSDNWACCEPWFQETGTNCPSNYPEDKQKEIMDLATESTLALGFKWGVFHVEAKYTSRGVRLIEVNARMGGISVRDANLAAWGVDLVEEHVMSALKIPLGPVIYDTPRVAFCQTAVNAPYSGTVTSSNFLDEIVKDPRCTFVSYVVSEGSKVKGPEEQVPSFLAELRFEAPADKLSDLLEHIKASIATVKPPIKPTNPDQDSVRKNSIFFPSHAYPFKPPFAG